MTDNEMDGGQTAGTSQDANSGGSSGDGDKQLSFDATKLQESLDALVTKVGELDARTKTLQGEKDKGVQKALTEVSDLKSKIAEYEKLKSKGLEPDEAFEEMDFRSAVKEIKDQLSALKQVSDKTPGTGAVGAAEAARVIAEYGLDANDAEVAKAIQNAQSVSEMDGSLAKIALRRVLKPAPSPAGAPAMQSGVPASGNLSEAQVEQLTAERNKLYVNPTVNAKRLEQIDKQLTEAGVPLD